MISAGIDALNEGALRERALPSAADALGSFAEGDPEAPSASLISPLLSYLSAPIHPLILSGMSKI